jgi:hypothetical protein
MNYFPICGGWINDRTVLHAIRVLKNSSSFAKIGLIYSRKLMYKWGKIYRAEADPLAESLSFNPVMGMAALQSNYSMSKDEPA